MSEYIYATNGELVANIDGDISLAREEIVRCRNCRFKAKDEYLCLASGLKFKVEPEGFCKWGKVR